MPIDHPIEVFVLAVAARVGVAVSKRHTMNANTLKTVADSLTPR